MPFFRLFKRIHVHLVQREDVEAVNAAAAARLWNDITAVAYTQFDNGLVDAIEMVDVEKKDQE